MFQIRVVIRSQNAQVTQFRMRTVPEGRATVLAHELLAVDSLNVSLMIEFANLTEYEYFAVFVRHGEKPTLMTDEYDFVQVVTGNREYGTQHHSPSYY